MANIRIKDLPADSAPNQNDIIPIDLTGTRGATVKNVVESGRPTASKTEAELGVEPQKAMTPLTTKQAIDAQVGAAYVPKTVKINAGDGLTGGGALTGDVTVGLNTASTTSLAKADSAVQSVNGKSGNSVALVKADVGLGNADNTSDINKPISTATQIALDGKYDNPSGTTSQYIRGDGSLSAFPAIPQGTVTSVGLTVPTGLSASGSPVTSSGTIAVSYAAGYQGYTSAEASKLSGIAAGAQVNTVNSVNTKTGAVVLNAADVGAAPDTVVADVNANTTARHTHSNKAILDATTASFLAAEKTKLSGIEAGAQVNTVTSVAGKTGSVTLVKADVGLGNVDNTSDASKPVSTSTQTALNAKANSSVTVSAGSGLTGGGNLTANRSIALNAASISSLGKADTALQAPGGATGQILAKASADDNDVAWVSSEAATAVSYGPQELTEAQKTQARGNIGAGTDSFNWIINGDFTINQRGGVKKPANGVYGFDRWKGHANGIEQIIEALPAGEYTLTWSGGGSSTFGGVTGVSPIKSTVTAGDRSVVVPQTATRVSLVEGDATAESDPFSPRHIQQELALCQRYCNKLTGINGQGAGVGVNPLRSFVAIPTMRASPTVVSFSNGAGSGQAVEAGRDFAIIIAFPDSTGLFGVSNVLLDAEL